MNISKSKIAILTTVINFELYKITSTHFPKGIRKYVIDGTNRMYGIDSIVFMISKLKDLDIDWLIMADEDVIFNNPNQVFDIIELMNNENFTVAGVRDGGVIEHRKHNPHVINTFFSILNFKNVLSIWDRKKMLKNQNIIPNEFKDILELPFSYNENSLFESYYCFYLWLRRNNKKFLFLDAKMEADGIANTVWYNNVNILCHTWYARNYGKDLSNTERINNYVSSIGNEYRFEDSTIIFKDKLFLMKRLIKLMKMKIIKAKTILIRAIKLR